jgi:deoxyribonuclease-4
MILGAHQSAAAGLTRCLERASSLDLAAVQLCTRSATRWFTPPIDPEDVVAFRKKSARFDRAHLFALASPLINLATPDAAVLKRSMDALYDEIMRAEALGLAWVIVQPGSHGGGGEERGVRQLQQSLNKVLDRTQGFKCGLLIETSAGTDDELGSQFEQLAKVRRRVDDSKRVGICLDSARLFASGYDLRDLAAYRRTMRDLERTIGLKHVKAWHLCDAMYPLGSKQSGPTHIGEGEIGSDGFACVMNDERFENVPLILETPRGPETEDDLRNLGRLSSLLGTMVVTPDER